MNSVQQMVMEGYQALAVRVLRLIEKAKLDSPHPVGREILSESRKRLEELAVSGDIHGMGEEGLKYFTLLARVLDDSIHPSFRPMTAKGNLGLALTFLSSYYQVDSKEMKNRLSLDTIISNPEIANARIIVDKSGKRWNQLLLYLDESIPAFSVVTTVRSLYMFLQPQQDEMLALLSQIKVAGFEKLQERVIKDPSLSKLQESLANKRTQMAFLKQPEILKIGLEEGVDMDALAAVMIESEPQLNFLRCYTCGDAFFKTVGMVRENSLLADLKDSAAFYGLLGYLHMLRSPLKTNGDLVAEVGIGICSYFVEHPDAFPLLKESRDFHGELSRTYFQEKGLC